MRGADAAVPQVRFIQVEPGVKLEVLDWGGSGPPLVLLTGLGHTAHVYAQFAHHFTDKFHVIAITRRGFGLSSQPARGYDVATRARDDIRVLDALKIPKAIFVGHSIAGDELSPTTSASRRRSWPFTMSSRPNRATRITGIWTRRNGTSTTVSRPSTWCG
jgi:hypothetical protein